MMPFWSGSKKRRQENSRVSFINFETHHPEFYNYSEIDNLQKETNLQDINVVHSIHYVI